MTLPGPTPPRRSGQLRAGSDRGELPLWAVLVVASGVLALGLGGGTAASGPGEVIASGGLSSGRVETVGNGGAGYLAVADDEFALVSPLEQLPSSRRVSLTLDGVDAASIGGPSGDWNSSAAPGQESEGSEFSVPTAANADSEARALEDRTSRAAELYRPGLREEGSFREGVPHELWRAWREDGSLRTQGAYANGLRDGVWESFSESGVVLSELTFEAGSRSGPWTAYSESGAVLEEGHYSGGDASGRWTAYYSDGQIKERGLFVNGLREGPWEFYNDLGLPTLQAGEYHAGIKIQ